MSSALGIPCPSSYGEPDCKTSGIRVNSIQAQLVAVTEKRSRLRVLLAQEENGIWRPQRSSVKRGFLPGYFLGHQDLHSPGISSVPVEFLHKRISLLPE